MCETKITDDIRNYMQNDACIYEIGNGLVTKNHIPWFGHRNKEKIEKLLDYIDTKHKNIQDKYVKIQEELKSNYIKAPVDSDGIPLHLCNEVTIDGLEGKRIIITMVYGIDGWVFGVNGNDSTLYPSNCIHSNGISEEYIATNMLKDIARLNKLYLEGYMSMATTMRTLNDIEEKYRNLLKGSCDE